MGLAAIHWQITRGAQGVWPREHQRMRYRYTSSLLETMLLAILSRYLCCLESPEASGTCWFLASEMHLGVGHVFWLRACVESISSVGMQLPERKRKGIKWVLHPKGKCAEVLGGDVRSFILLAWEFEKVGKGANYERDLCGSRWKIGGRCHDIFPVFALVVKAVVIEREPEVIVSGGIFPTLKRAIVFVVSCLALHSVSSLVTRRVSSRHPSLKPPALGLNWSWSQCPTLAEGILSMIPRQLLESSWSSFPLLRRSYGTFRAMGVYKTGEGWWDTLGGGCTIYSKLCSKKKVYREQKDMDFQH